MDRVSVLADLLPANWDPIVRRSMLLVIGVVAWGTAGYTYIEGWTLWQSLFFTLVTLTTVGYGDYGLSEAGERFTAVLMIGGIGIVSYSASLVLQRIMARATQPEKRMIEQARKMHDHHIVCGLGRTGQRVIMKLLDEGAAVVAIDDNPAIVEELRAQGIIAMHGDATSDLALMHAGVTRAQSLAAVTASDAINALICLSAHALSPDLTIIARAEDESSICKLQRAGAMQVIAPASYGGDGIAENMIHPDIARLLPGLQGGDDALEFAELCITEHSPFCDRAISEIGREFPRMVFIAARSHDGTMMLRPPSDRVLTEGEVLVIAGTVGDVAQMRVRRQAA